MTGAQKDAVLRFALRTAMCALLTSWGREAFLAQAPDVSPDDASAWLCSHEVLAPSAPTPA